MTNIEVIDRLCAVSTSLLDMVVEQQALIEQLADTETLGKLREKLEKAQKELDVLEYSLRRVCR